MTTALEMNDSSDLFREPPRGASRWLPAYIVRGEGIYIEFEEDTLREWEQRASVVGAN